MTERHRRLCDRIELALFALGVVALLALGVWAS
jgi:hypothetical protein